VTVYVDAPPVIYFVERVPEFHARAKAWLTDSENVLVASDLTRMECRIVPVRKNDQLLLEGFDRFFAYSVSALVSLSRTVVDRATMIRAEYGFRTPDAFHLAAALEGGCDIFLTNDLRLRRFRDLTIEALTP